MKTKLAVRRLFALFSLLGSWPMVESGIAAPLPEYTAAEARKHIGEKATVVGKVACRSQGRTYELLQLEGCGAKSAFDVVARTEEVNGVESEGVTIAVSGTIGQFQDAVQIVVQSASQIVPRTPKQTDYTGIAEAFVQAYSGTDLDTLASLYADRVDHTNSGVISNAAVRAQAREYFTRWPVRQWSLIGPVKTTPLGATRQKAVFSASYDVSDPQANRHASGIAKETLTLAPDKSGALKIVSQKEQTSKRSSRPSDDSGKKTSANATLETAKAEYEASSRDEAARVRYVTRLAEIHTDISSQTHDKAAAIDQARPVHQELRRHPMPPSVDSTRLTQQLIGEWTSPRHVYVFRADGTYGVADADRYKWRIDGNQFVDDGSRKPIILLDDHYFIYADGVGVAFYTRVKDPIKSDRPSDLTIKQSLVGYWKFTKAVCYIAADGTMYVGPRKNETEKSRWNVKDGQFYWDNVVYTIVTLTDDKFVFREIGAQKSTFTLIRSTKEEVGPD